MKRLSRAAALILSLLLLQSACSNTGSGNAEETGTSSAEINVSDAETAAPET